LVDDPKSAVEKTRRKRAPDKKETKRERFERMANARTDLVLDKIRILGCISNTRYYDYTPEDVDEIFSSINEALETARSKFFPSAQKEPVPQFQLEKRLKNRSTKTED
jgi:hypothetical protein